MVIEEALMFVERGGGGVDGIALLSEEDAGGIIE